MLQPLELVHGVMYEATMSPRRARFPPKLVTTQPTHMHQVGILIMVAHISGAEPLSICTFMACIAGVAASMKETGTVFVPQWLEHPPPIVTACRVMVWTPIDWSSRTLRVVGFDVGMYWVQSWYVRSVHTQFNEVVGTDVGFNPFLEVALSERIDRGSL